MDICRKHELKRAEESGEDVAALRAHYIEEYKEEFFNPYKAAEYGKFEDVIEPAESRRVIIRTLELFQNKQVVLPAKNTGICLSDGGAERSLVQYGGWIRPPEQG